MATAISMVKDIWRYNIIVKLIIYVQSLSRKPDCPPLSIANEIIFMCIVYYIILLAIRCICTVPIMWCVNNNNNNNKEWARFTRSLFIHLLKLYINDCAIMTIESDGSTQIYRPSCGAARPAQTLACTCTSWQIMWLAQSATQETRVAASLARAPKRRRLE